MKSRYIFNNYDKDFIKAEYDLFVKNLIQCNRPEDRELIDKAFRVANEAHLNMRRKSGEPFMIRLISVAKIVNQEIGLGARSIAAALLQELVEDTDYSLDDIKRDFDPMIASLIDGLTKISGTYSKDNLSSLQAENFRKMLVTLSDDLRVILIKIAGCLHNMRTLDSMPEYKKMKISDETIFLYAPLAHRLGLYAIKCELEDLSFRFRQPQTYNYIFDKVKQGEGYFFSLIEKFSLPLKEKLSKEGFHFDICGRPKSIYSIWKKMQAKNIPIEEVYEVLTVKIVFEPFAGISEKNQCWSIYSIVTDLYLPKPDMLRDWVSRPKPNGYEALHVTVMGPELKWIEVQIRSKRMDEIAERGYAAHWKNKGDASNETELDKWIKKIRLTLDQPHKDPIEFLDEFKMNLFSEEILIYTPKGLLVCLPKNATALDFAYEIHTEIGNKAIGAKINYKLCPLNTILNSGDQVEIITSDLTKPEKEWLNMVITTKAKDAIKYTLKKESKDIEHQQDLINELELEEKLSEFKYLEAKEYIFNKFRDNEKIKYLLTKYSFLFGSEKNKIYDKNKFDQNLGYFRYLIDIWLLLGDNKIIDVSDNKHFTKIRKQSDENELLENRENAPKTIYNLELTEKTENKNSEIIGEILEKSVIKLFEYFFSIENETQNQILTKLRKQKRGTQYGFDIEFNCNIKGKEEIIGLIECKNIKSQKAIEISNISNKLLVQISKPENKYDFWILISPNRDPSNELNEHLKLLNDKFNTNLQIWSPETFVDEFFGIVPEIYDMLGFIPSLDSKHPSKWTEGERNKIIEKWKLKLIPQFVLPKKIREYLKNPSNFLLNSEKDNSREYDKLYFNHIKRYCYEDTNEAVELELDSVISNWLNTSISKEPTIFLLGDFGDGKSTYTYILCRLLSEKIIENPKTSWIPIRFSFKSFSFEDERNSYNFLKESLDQIGLNLTDWHDLISKHRSRVLLILDGFDEISKNIDYSTISENFDKLVKYYNEYFCNIKILITSRKHFLSHSSQKERLLGRLGKPKLFHLLPFERANVINHLNENIGGKDDINKLQKLKDFYDPIGLATKPLFLEMLKITIQDLPEQNLNEIILYSTYVRKCLTRKIDQIDKQDIGIGYENIINNLIGILKRIALELHKQKSEFVFLSDISDGKKELKYAEKLWEMTKNVIYDEDDAKSRIAVRSLLTRINVHTINPEKKWPVDFFQRSLKEYFVALGLLDLLNNEISGLIVYLEETVLNYEIINFLSNLMKESKIDYTNELLFLIHRTRNISDQNVFNRCSNLGCNAINILYQYKHELPGVNWNNLILDGANLADADLTGKNFSYSFLRNANLDNVIFNNADFSYANIKGVKIEETSDVVSISVNKFSNCFYAMYDDLTIKEWVYKNNVKQHPDTLIKIENNIGYGKILLLDNTILYYNKDRIILFKKSPNKKVYDQSIIELNHNISIYKLKRDFVLVINNYDPINKLIYLIDIYKRELIYSRDYKIDEIYENLADEALVLYSKNKGLSLIPFYLKEEKSIELDSSDNISSITTFSGCQDSYLIATGHTNGTVQLFSIQTNESKWNIEKIFLDTCHAETVKELVFIDQFNILTVSSDKKICHMSFQKGNLKAMNKNYFFLKIQCKNVNIKGLKGEKEFNKFLEFKRFEKMV